MISRHDVEQAASRIAPHVRRTPIVAFDPATILKLELLQHTGSFKARGAFNFILSQPDVPEAGVVAASGGNHGQAVAYAARALGVRAEVFVPEVCPPVKRARIAAMGAQVVVGGAVYDDAQAACEARAAETGAVLVHPFDSPEVIAGQGTVAHELAADVAGLDTVLIAVGGGGLLGGCLAWYERGVKVVAVEPVSSQALHAALAAGGPVDVDVSGVAADSLGARRIGLHAYALAERHLDTSITVTDEAIVQAQRRLWDEVRLVAEPGGATAFAALSSGAYRPVRGERVGVIVCGANVDLRSLVADVSADGGARPPAGDPLSSGAAGSSGDPSSPSGIRS